MIRLLILAVGLKFALAAVDDIAAVLITNNTDGNGGPTKEWIAQVSQKVAAYAAQQTKNIRINIVKTVDPDMEQNMKTFREYLGPRSNMTNSASSESPDELKNFALEGDMILNPDQWDHILQKKNRKRAVTTNPNVLWTIGTPIAYVIDPSLSSVASKVRAGIKFWSDNSCLTFVESSTATPRLHYYRGSGCWSYIGKQNSWGVQDISIGVGCDSHGTICHETAHAMGFYHTQSRYDRDNYLTIYQSNIQPSQTYNFVKQTTATETHFNLPYDYGSVMQYDPYAFAINTNYPTSAARDPNYQNSMGQREAPSFSDIMEMNLLYKCANLCSNKPPCVNNGIVNPNTCKDCLCPRYYAGPYCQGLNPGTAPVCNGAVAQATSTSWTSLNATMGLGMTYKYADVDIPADCYWLIQAATGRKLQLQVTFLSTTCMESCPWGAFEINIGNVNQYGIITCCSSVYSQTFTTVNNIAVIRGYSRYNNINMLINYRVV